MSDEGRRSVRSVFGSLGSMLAFGELRVANVLRCEAVFHKLHRWNALEWAGAMCGEAGEASNLCKKLRRLDEADHEKDTPAERTRLADAIVVELADVVIYADLLAAYLDRDLGETVRAKFNEVSEKRGSRILL